MWVPTRKRWVGTPKSPLGVLRLVGWKGETIRMRGILDMEDAPGVGHDWEKSTEAVGGYMWFCRKCHSFHPSWDFSTPSPGLKILFEDEGTYRTCEEVQVWLIQEG